MRIVRQFYVADNIKFDNHKVGKWMYFFKDEEFAEKICKNAVVNNIVKEAKYTDSPEGVVCFYIHYDGDKAHKKVIQYFLEN